jgi:hypothetical protein
MNRLALTAVLVVLLVGGIGGAQQSTTGPNVTVYSDLGFIEELRAFSVSQGESDYLIEDLPTAILPDSVVFRPIKPGVEILEQEFLPAQTVSGEQLLQDYLSEEIEVTVARGLVPKTYRGTLISVEDGIVLQEVTGRIQFIRDYSEIAFAELPEYRTAPGLLWRAQSDSTGEVTGYLSYLTGGLGWSAYYTAILNEAENQMSLGSWVTLTNHSGREYANAKLTLIAGELHRVIPPPPAIPLRAVPQVAVEKDIETRPTFEYHEYKLPRPTTVKDKQTLQLSFLQADSITVSKHYVYEATISPHQVRVEVRFTNDEPSGLGVALPAGVVRLYKETAGSLQLIGEDSLAHTPKNEKVTLVPGMAFDLKAERILKDRQVIDRDQYGRETYRETYEITLRNQKDSAVVVEVKERLQGTWKIISAEPTYEKLDANTILFKAPIKAEGAATVTYTVEWKY